MTSTNKIDGLRNQIEDLREQRKSGKLIPEQRQLLTDRINEIRAQITELTAPEKKVVSVTNAPIVAEHKTVRGTRLTSTKAFL